MNDVRPDLTGRPFVAHVERMLPISPARLYQALTNGWDQWFAQPGTATVEAVIGRPFFFETCHENQRHPHYGRFLRLEPEKSVELTWVTGALGTGGAETVLTLSFAADGDGSHVSLTHAGFYDAAAARQHEDAWRGPVLDALVQRYSSDGRRHAQ